MIQGESQLNEKEEIKDNQNGEESDDKTERTIKNLRITPATPLEQNMELLRFIAKKESKVLELKEELKRQEEELRLLKNQWKTIVAKDDQNGIPETVGDEGIKFIGKGINSVIDGIHKVKDKEAIKTAVSDVANSTSVKKTRQAWSNISKGFSSFVESKAVKTAKRKTLETVHTVERTINEALISPTKTSYTQCPTTSSSSSTPSSPITSPKLSSSPTTTTNNNAINSSTNKKSNNNKIITKEIKSSPDITINTNSSIVDGSPTSLTSSTSIISFTSLTSPTTTTANINSNNKIIFDNKSFDVDVSPSNFTITSDISDTEENNNSSDDDDDSSIYVIGGKDSCDNSSEKK
ncbi:hypothetical protein Glove_30g60 [Diversispora epigaea]|uniref:Uncharacterized protein n=1 Tax=Diversispora epigaea TaxID=1348612 RepID=A0A397JS65_9GLOM|nr:hypothetical protein Glove_30g60 [Diversispora epigaea]